LYNEHTLVIKQFTKIEKANTLLDTISEKQTEKLGIVKEIAELDSLLYFSKKIEEMLVYFEAVRRAKKLLMLYDDLIEEIGEIRKSKTRLTSVVSEYTKLDNEITTCSTEVSRLKALMPSVCPLCGNKMEESND
jgi:hypothetical protein